ncbi:methylated-DNA--[protein]-cysteine S-methyltransferase [Neorhizobium lilium]|uniref:Methylated-DNA--[protein]-cysteine S-methyltransferase n=1 Tax=Neorhizobium lilium TaxID=2503024 RepID=A0A3S3S4R5_9HYPH|nr:methylated-DNA--[protein]-cysteine S-methyltransferase [Neorhizobium lilium]RWX76720.1 methylated-DNA--[protein]-cysteine S-methyltransferase [Neorhizobium lilium]
MTSHRYTVFHTAGGFCGLAWNDAGISRFQLPTQSEESTERLLLKRLSPEAISTAPSDDILRVVADVRRYFAGESTDFTHVRLDLGAQDELFRQIYAAARRLAWGETATYGALAKAVGRGPEAARDVGQAMARNPVALIIPCHRVLAAGGKIGGFSAPGGAISKARMLELEGVRLTRPEPQAAQQSFGF